MKITSNLSYRKQNSIMLNYCTEVRLCHERQNNLLSSSLQFGNTLMFIALIFINLSEKELIEVDQPFHSYRGMLVSFLYRNADSLGNLIL